MGFHSGGQVILKDFQEMGRCLFVFFGTEDVVLRTESHLMTRSDLLNALGGNLGLFLGFSVVSGFLQILGLCRKIYKIG